MPRPARISLDRRMPDAIRSTLQGAEALSVGLVQAVTETVVTAVRGVQEVGAEIGTTAVSALRGSIHAVEEIGGDLGRLAMSATGGGPPTRGGVRGAGWRAAGGAAAGAGPPAPPAWSGCRPDVRCRKSSGHGVAGHAAPPRPDPAGGRAARACLRSRLGCGLYPLLLRRGSGGLQEVLATAGH